MPIRPARYSDLLPASRLLARAFRGEYIFVPYMHPYLDQYPDDLYLHFLRILRKAYVSGPDHPMFVSYCVDENGQEELTGIAHWHRNRTTPSSSLHTSSLIKAAEWYNYFESFFYPNRAAEPSRLKVLAQSGPFIAHHWTGTRAEGWYLSQVGVDPAHEGKGIGRELVAWGFAKAREEGVGLSVICSDGKEGFYERCGFDQRVGTTADEGGDANPLRNIPGGTILFWDNGQVVQGVKKYLET